MEVMCYRKRQFVLLFVLLVFTHHEGGCWSDAPYSAVRHLRQLNKAGISPEDVPDKIVISPRSFRPLFSWDITTAESVSTTIFPNHQRESTDGSSVSNTQIKGQGGKALWKKQIKKNNLGREAGHSTFWVHSVTNSSGTTLSISRGSASSSVSDIWLMRAEKQKHRKKVKKERDKTTRVGRKEEVTKKKQKLGKLEDGNIKNKKKRKKERKKHKEEHRDKAQVKKRKKVQQSSNKFAAVVPAIDITSRSRSETGSKEDRISKIPSYNENSVDAVFGRFKNKSYRIGLHVTEKKVNSEDVNNEIKAGKLHPLLHTSENSEHLKPENEEIIDDNKIPLFQMKEVPGLLGINSAPEYDKIHDAYISEGEVESERAKLLPEVSSLTPKSITIGSTDAETWLQSGTKQDAGLEEQSHIELNSLEVFKFVNTTEESDWSCLHGMILPAPRVANAEVRYTRGKYLEAEYECQHNYKLESEEAVRLVCMEGKWLGKPPKCVPLSNSSISTPSSCMCDQLCTAVGNQLVCSCFRGFRQQGTACHDLDECLESNGGCAVACRNTPGSYQCICPSGLRLSANGKTCLDINECLLRNGHGPCQGSCQNLPGSYTCSCDRIVGTRLAADNHTCEDVDECAQNNAGCSHTCLNTLGRAFCLCPSGFVLGTDWKTCHDIDECADPELQEGGHCSLGCVNTLGSYQCVDLSKQVPDDHPPTSTEPTITISSMPAGCAPGFEVGPSGSCVDIDECATNKGGCSHICQNTLGGAHCLCPRGFMLGNDWKSCKAMGIRNKKEPNISIICEPGYVHTTGGHCKDVDECTIQNGGCMQGCVNIRGSYHCLCGHGFFLGADRKTCIEERVDIVCPPLPTPSYGYLHCIRRAFMVGPERWRARWRRRIVNHAGAVCELRCPHGYQVHGEYWKVCEASGSWAGPQDGFCMPFPKPKIECPHNISVEIEPTQPTAFVVFPQPTTDVDWFRNVVSEPSWGKLLEADLPPGYWLVTFTAYHPISRRTASCTIDITVSVSNTSTEGLQEKA